MTTSLWLVIEILRDKHDHIAHLNLAETIGQSQSMLRAHSSLLLGSCKNKRVLVTIGSDFPISRSQRPNLCLAMLPHGSNMNWQKIRSPERTSISRNTILQFFVSLTVLLLQLRPITPRQREHHIFFSGYLCASTHTRSHTQGQYFSHVYCCSGIVSSDSRSAPLPFIHSHYNPECFACS